MRSARPGSSPRYEPSAVCTTESPSSVSSGGSSVIAGSRPNGSSAADRELARERLAAVLGEQRGVLRQARAVAERLEDRDEVADRDGLGEQELQHAVHLADGARVRHELVDDGRVALAQVVEQRARVLAARGARRRARGSSR